MMHSEHYPPWPSLSSVAVVTIALVILLMVTLSPKPAPPSTPDEILLAAVIIDTDDLRPLALSWSPANIERGPLDVPNGIGADVWFRRSYSYPWINVAEKVYVYPSAAAARQGYEIRLQHYARYELQGWEALPDLAFSHHADTMHPSCTEGYINGEHHFACDVVGRYGRVVIAVAGNIYDKRWLTAGQFRSLLITADWKANQSRKAQ